MNRRSFLKSIGVGAAAVTIAPALLTESTIYQEGNHLDGIWHQIQKGNVIKYNGITIEHIKEAVRALGEWEQERQIKLHTSRSNYEQFMKLM